MPQRSIMRFEAHEQAPLRDKTAMHPAYTPRTPPVQTKNAQANG